MDYITVPEDYDYIGVYLTDTCFLHCSYCITGHHGAMYLNRKNGSLTPEQWIAGLNQLELPPDTPITLQGGEPFLYKGIWEILEKIRHKVDIMTALPPFLTTDHFRRLKTLNWNQRQAAYPRIRVSYHRGQNNYHELIDRIADMQKVVSIGLYYMEAPVTPQEEIDDLCAYAQKSGVDARKKDFLGEFNGKMYGHLRYSEAALGRPHGCVVLCKNTVVPIAPDGTIYRCHSDLYFRRQECALGNILNKEFSFPVEHLPCNVYGMCSACDVKIKTNRYQQYGYTSVDIKFVENSIERVSEK